MLRKKLMLVLMDILYLKKSQIVGANIYDQSTDDY